MGRPYHINPIIRGVLSTMTGLYESDGWHNEENLSPAEVDLATALWDASVRGFHQQHTMGRYTVDFWFPDADLVVEVDGRTYHRDLEREKKRSRALLKAGARRVIHFDAGTVMAEPDECVRAIRWYIDFAAKERSDA
jgi:very-short-patch-repair endonuclease